MSNQETDFSTNSVSNIVNGIRVARESAKVGTQSDMHLPNYTLLQGQEEIVVAPTFDYEDVAGVGLMPTLPPQGPQEQ